MTFDERLVGTVPDKRQTSFQQLGFYAFVHFGMNTFTDREWGDGRESPCAVRSGKAERGAVVRTVKSAGMKGLILTCKHHGGFCL